jgi:hypothetical protein
VTLEEACAAFATTVAPEQALTVTLRRVVIEEGHLKILQAVPMLVEPEVIKTLKVGTVKWLATLRLPQAGSVLHIERPGDTIAEAEAALAASMAEVLAEEERARAS